MFRCDKCGSVAQAGEAAHKVIVQQREREYDERSKEVPTGRSGRHRTRVEDRGGAGKEIVREMTMCSSCAVEYE
ncbi:hypothetical protein [Stratiformator vulcanicus]|uniref:Uncharacterized protein n=1 Tax=Stratiformator vulcanicus TaxID=2527980 RepID=A0A517R529_9PLAN|nr:hypothetical protein [Stratiformator vulcanicus]QDT38996.1 hypothetical protein Pan189_33970 [Stratiformator vulcanicus]